MIRLKAIVRTFGAPGAGEAPVPVLKGVDLEVAPGEHVAITGPSGSGKSTLLQVLGLLDRPDQGEYWLDGRSVAGLSDDALSATRSQTIGFVFQAFHLLPALSVLENAALPGQYSGLTRVDRLSRAQALLARVGLAHRLAHHPAQLSGGERQRVAVARALLNQPRLLLADEPTGNLDSQARDEVLALFDEVRAETGLTLVVVTHDPEVASRAARVIRMKDGRVV